MHYQCFHPAVGAILRGVPNKTLRILILGVLLVCDVESEVRLPPQEHPTTGIPPSSIRASAPVHWPLPVAEHTKVPLAVAISNRSSEPTRYPLMDTIRIRMMDPSTGRSFEMDGGRNATRPGKTLTEIVPPGGTIEVLIPASLVRSQDGTSNRLTGDDGFGGLWYVDGLQAGRYLLQLTLENHRSRFGDFGHVWTGTAGTPPVEVVIGDAKPMTDED